MPTLRSIEPILLDGGPAHGATLAVDVGVGEVVISVPDSRNRRRSSNATYLRTSRRSRVGRPIFEHLKAEKRGATAR